MCWFPKVYILLKPHTLKSHISNVHTSSHWFLYSALNPKAWHMWQDPVIISYFSNTKTLDQHFHNCLFAKQMHQRHTTLYIQIANLSSLPTQLCTPENFCNAMVYDFYFYSIFIDSLSFQSGFHFTYCANLSLKNTFSIW